MTKDIDNKPARGDKGRQEQRHGEPSGNAAPGQPPSSPRQPQGQRAEVDTRPYAQGRQFGQAGAFGQAHQSRDERPADPESEARKYPPSGYSASDERVREEIGSRLEHSGLPIDKVSVSVHTGQGQLIGSVPDEDASRHIELAAAGCEGVKGVHNELTIENHSGNG